MPGKKILVVDDDTQLVDSVRTLLESAGYEVHCAFQAEKARTFVREMHLDLIVMDILFTGLPGGDGVQPSRRLAHDPELKDIPVLILSGARKAPGIPGSFEPGETHNPLHAFLEKPFRPEEFLSEIQHLLALQDSEDAKRAGRILVVDDDPDFVAVVTRILTTAGFEIATAANGAQALAAIHQRKPDLVLLDIMMSSVLDGLSVSEEMQANPELRDVPIIMVSSIANTEYAAAFPTDGEVHMAAWITKPVAPEALLRTVDQYLK